MEDLIKENLAWACTAAYSHDMSLDDWLSAAEMPPEGTFEPAKLECIAYAYGYLQGVADERDQTLTEMVDSYGINTDTIEPAVEI